MKSVTNNQRPSWMPTWRFWVPLLLQTGLILSVPAQAVYTHLTGRTVVLQTVPVDPYDLLRGYFVTVDYEISRLDTLKALPGWKALLQDQPGGSADSLALGESFYVILASPQSSASRPPEPWKPVQISRDRPTNLPADQVAIQGQYVQGVIKYGLETYYIPEEQRDQINEDINRAQRRDRPQSEQPQAMVLEAKVDANGHAVPLSLWIGGEVGQEARNYRF